MDEYEHLRESADSDTPRDPLAAALEAIWPYEDDADYFAGKAAALRKEIAGTLLDATRPSGDEALRAAAQAVADLTNDYDLNERGQAVMADLRAALATPSSAPDVEGLRPLVEAADAEYVREEAMYRKRRSPSKHLLIDYTRRSELKDAAEAFVRDLLDSRS